MEIISKDEKRAELIAALVLAEWPRHYAEECVDLALHATHEMCEVLKRITGSGSMNLVQSQSFILASDMMVDKLTTCMEMADGEYDLKTVEELEIRKQIKTMEKKDKAS